MATASHWYCQSCPSPLGTIALVADEKALTQLTFLESQSLEQFVEKLKTRRKAEISVASNPVLEQTKQQLAEYFAGERTQFDLPLAPNGTEFQHQAWQQLRAIGYGQTRSYGEQAQAIGNPKAVRAVGSANSRNPIAVVIPCHRVIGSNGKLTGYAGGLDKKQWLLDWERTRGL